MDPETAHERTLKMLQGAGQDGKPHWMVGAVPDCPVNVMGLRFPNPLGLAAGMDKNGDCIQGFGSLGFGFLEIGTVTPRPQPGNSKPRLFRLVEHEGIINRMGFNNEGVEHLVAQARQRTYKGVVGINLGKNFDTPIEEANKDYVKGLRAVYDTADYVAINISSPNTTNLRELQKEDALASLLGALASAREDLVVQHGTRVPLALKIAPDVTEEQLDAIVGLLLEHGMDGVIATNTTIDRSAVQGHPRAGETGGLSGAPVRARSTEVVRGLASRLDGRLPIIGVGGIFGPDDAKEKLDAGASLIQVYSGLIYKGPRMVKQIVTSLV